MVFEHSLGRYDSRCAIETVMDGVFLPFLVLA